MSEFWGIIIAVIGSASATFFTYAVTTGARRKDKLAIEATQQAQMAEQDRLRVEMIMDQQSADLKLERSRIERKDLRIDQLLDQLSVATETIRGLTDGKSHS